MSSEKIKILFIGDIVGSAGKKLVQDFVPALRLSECLDLVIANGENIAGGKGIERKTANELFESGVDVITGGNHSWDKKEVIEFINVEPRLLRPLNYPQGVLASTPGSGTFIFNHPKGAVAVVNIMGRVFMEPQLDCPFHCAQREFERLSALGVKMIIVDFHAEATSEKQAFGHFLTGKVSAVLGTHSHVQTADERILKNELGNTAYITDAGMTGPYDSVIGVKKELSIARFLTRMPVRYEPAEKNPGLHGVIIEVNVASGCAESIKRVSLFS